MRTTRARGIVPAIIVAGASLGIVAAIIVAGGSLGIVAASAGSISRVPTQRVPRIVARPASVMVNAKTELSGSGFRPHRRLTIWECSQQTWVVPVQVCNHKNAVHVRTSGTGRFRVSLVALMCPARKRAMAPAGFSRTCYAGVPAVRGVDTVTLVGAAKFTVTVP